MTLRALDSCALLMYSFGHRMYGLGLVRLVALVQYINRKNLVNDCYSLGTHYNIVAR